MASGQDSQQIFALESDNNAVGKWNLLTSQSHPQTIQNAPQNTLYHASIPFIDEQGQDMKQNGSAALAFDSKWQRLFYVSMLSGEAFFHQQSDATLNGVKYQSIGNVYEATVGNKIGLGPKNQGAFITRLTAAADGYIYGLSNDGSVFFRINAAKPQQVEALESLNKMISNHQNPLQDEATGWGGDMVADDLGGLYIFTAKGSVFYLNYTLKKIEKLGEVKGLPADYLISGAAVQADGSIQLAESSGNRSFEVADVQTLVAIRKNAFSQTAAGDLASGMFIRTQNQKQAKEALAIQGLKAYPNPVVNKMLTLQVTGVLQTADFQVEVLGANGGRQIAQKYTLVAHQQQMMVPLKSLPAGSYFVKVTNQTGYYQVAKIILL